MKIIGLLINSICLLGAIAWYLTDGGYEPIIAILTFIGSLLYIIFGTEQGDKKLIIKQKGGKGSTNNQAGRDMTINKK